MNENPKFDSVLAQIEFFHYMNKYGRHIMLPYLWVVQQPKPLSLKNEFMYALYIFLQNSF
jgi:hypothetical protein